MSEQNNGGAAFPVIDGIERDFRGRLVPEYSGGMSLRDYFAAKALGGMIAAMSDNAVREMMLENAVAGERTPKQQMAFSAYEYADEMLAERTK